VTEALRILLVEDNPGDADMTCETLTDRVPDVAISVVNDGEKALAYLSGRAPYEHVARPDLVILDLNLPKVDGREVLAEIKQDPSLKKIPVVILTSSDAPSDVVRSYELGANSYVTKPIGLGAFQSVVLSLASYWLELVELP